MEKALLISQVLKRNNGFVRTSEIIALNISKTYFATYIKKHQLVKVSHGLYMTQDTWQDDMYILQVRYPDVVFSHSTAAFLHNLSDREPDNQSVTLKSGKGTARLNRSGVKVYKIKEELYSLGIIEVESPTGHMVKTYDAERTVCDLIRSRNKLDAQEVQTVIIEYFRKRDRNIPRLMRYAKIFSIEKILKLYTEVMLR